MKKNVITCPNPACPTNTQQDKGIKLRPWNVLYKCEKAGFDTHYVTAPRLIGGGWSKRVISPLAGYRDAEIDTNVVYCPECHAPIHIDREVIRVAVVGPRNCGKTVYLTVLNELVTQPEYMGNLNFSREKSTYAFSFRVEHDGANKRYVLPRPTQAGAAGATLSANIPYMDYSVSLSVDFADIGAMTDGKSKRKKGKKSGTLANKKLEMYFYDVAGEWFMPNEKTSQEIRDNDQERNRRLAYLYDADLILFMIDCRQIVANDAGDITNLLEKGELTFEEYGRTIKQRIQEIRAKNHKDYYVAFCYLAADIFEKTQSAYKSVAEGNFDFRLRKDGNLRDASVFDTTKYEKCWKVTSATFRNFNHKFSDLINDKGKDGKPILDPSRMGLFTISSLGSGAKISIRSNSYGAEKYIDSFEPTKSWGVVDPILWYLAKRGIITQNTDK